MSTTPVKQPQTTAFPTFSVAPDQYGDPCSEGRVQTLEFEHFFLVNVYTPNAKSDLSRLQLRHAAWDPSFLQYLKQLEQTKPVVTCGDFNAAHEPIDLARPKQNTTHAGFTPEERQGISNLLAAGFIDTFRTLHPDAARYTWWSHWGQARANNVGWRIDYFFISEALRPALVAAEIYEPLLGSDHCPISVTLDFSRLNPQASATPLTLFSWNINGLRAVLRKSALTPVFEQYSPDILCFQEIKATQAQVETDFPDYEEFWNPAVRPGYAGTATLVKSSTQPPIDHTPIKSAAKAAKAAKPNPAASAAPQLPLEF